MCVKNFALGCVHSDFFVPLYSIDIFGKMKKRTKRIILVNFIAMVAVTLVFAIILLAKHPKNMNKIFRLGLRYAPAAGVANAICNVLMLLLATMLPGAVLYPSVSAGGIVFTFITALILYKERYTKWQYVGYACGIISVVLLSL